MSRNMDIDRVCLVCLQQEKHMTNVLEKPDEIAPKDLTEIINECTGYKHAHLESLPQQICGDCKQSAIDAFKFKRKCEEAYKTLIEIFKIEIPLPNFHKNAATQTERTPQYPCEHCDKEYSTVHNLMLHQLKAHKSNHQDFQFPNQCRMCSRQFTSLALMRRHIAKVHKKRNCDKKCDKSQIIEQSDDLSSLPNIEEVDLKILTENRIIPDNSNQNDDNLLVYIKHFDITDDEDNEPLSTLQQAEKSIDALDIIKLEPELKEKHVKNEGAANSNPLENSIPSETDTHEEVVSDKHTNIIDETKTDPKNKGKIHCDICDKVFNQSSQLQRHKRTKHLEKIHKCNICEKKFTTATYLQRHVIMHTKKRYSCKECSQNFPTKEELHDHVKAEGHDKRLLCPECGLRCRTSNILMVHLRRHKGEKPFKCKFCSKGFPRSDDLRLHEKYHTGEKSHFCGTCGKGFQRKYNLKIHLRVHTGEKPYKCPHCPQAFAQGNDLKAHIRRHTGERFQCIICGANFLQGYQVRQHRLSEHGIRDEPPTQRVAKFTSIEAQKQQILQNMEQSKETSATIADT